MTILVSAAALRTSGARTIYRQFLEHLKTRVDGNQYYIMVDKDMEMPPIDGVSYIVVDVSNKIKRAVFELFGFKRILKHIPATVELVVSLQNLGIRQLRYLRQIIYYHQPLPFFDYRWNLFHRDELVMWLYKNLYPLLVKRSIGRNVDMITQLPSIKEGIVKKYGVEENHVHVLFPDLEQIDIQDIPFEPTIDSKKLNLIYPATFQPYKGHEFLVRVIARLKEQGLAEDIRIHLTLEKDKNVRLVSLMKAMDVEGNFVFHGVVPHDRLLSMYKSSVGLLFPSVIETLGLPLIESARFGKAIIACDLKYAHEVLGEYSGARFVEPRSTKGWADAIINVMDNRKQYCPLEHPERSSWETFFDLIESKSR